MLFTGQQLDLGKQSVAPAPATADGNELGIITTRAVDKGRELVTVPDNLWICVETVSKSEHGSLLAGLEPWVQVNPDEAYTRVDLRARVMLLKGLGLLNDKLLMLSNN